MKTRRTKPREEKLFHLTEVHNRLLNDCLLLTSDNMEENFDCFHFSKVMDQKTEVIDLTLLSSDDDDDYDDRQFSFLSPSHRQMPVDDDDVLSIDCDETFSQYETSALHHQSSMDSDSEIIMRNNVQTEDITISENNIKLSTKTDISFGKPILRHTIEFTTDAEKELGPLLLQLSQKLLKNQNNDEIISETTNSQNLQSIENKSICVQTEDLQPEHLPENSMPNSQSQPQQKQQNSQQKPKQKQKKQPKDSISSQTLPKILCVKCYQIYNAKTTNSKCPYCDCTSILNKNTTTNNTEPCASPTDHQQNSSTDSESETVETNKNKINPLTEFEKESSLKSHSNGNQMLCGECYKIFDSTLNNTYCPHCSSILASTNKRKHSAANIIHNEVITLQNQTETENYSDKIIVTIPSHIGGIQNQFYIPIAADKTIESTTINSYKSPILNAESLLDPTYIEPMQNDSAKIVSVTDSNVSNNLMNGTTIELDCNTIQTQIPTSILYICRICKKLYDGLQTNNCCPICMPILELDTNNLTADQLVQIQYNNGIKTAYNADDSNTEIQVPSDLDISCFMDLSTNEPDFISQAVKDNLQLMTNEQNDADTLASYFGFFDSNMEDDLNQQYYQSQQQHPQEKQLEQHQQPQQLQLQQPEQSKSIASDENITKSLHNISYTKEEVSVVLWNCDPLIKIREKQKLKRKKEEKKAAMLLKKQLLTDAYSGEKKSKMDMEKCVIKPIKLKKNIEIGKCVKNISNCEPVEWKIVGAENTTDHRPKLPKLSKVEVMLFKLHLFIIILYFYSYFRLTGTKV